MTCSWHFVKQEDTRDRTGVIPEKGGISLGKESDEEVPLSSDISHQKGSSQKE